MNTNFVPSSQFPSDRHVLFCLLRNGKLRGPGSARSLLRVIRVGGAGSRLREALVPGSPRPLRGRSLGRPSGPESLRVSLPVFPHLTVRLFPPRSLSSQQPTTRRRCLRHVAHARGPPLNSHPPAPRCPSLVLGHPPPLGTVRLASPLTWDEATELGREALPVRGSSLQKQQLPLYVCLLPFNFVLWEWLELEAHLCSHIKYEYCSRSSTSVAVNCLTSELSSPPT